MKGEERRGREGILEIEGDCLSNLGILGIYLSLFVFVLRFEFSYRLSTDSRHISPSFSSLSLSPYLPPLFTLLSSFSAVSRPLTSLRSFLLCEYFPSFLSSFLEKKIQEDAYLSLSRLWSERVILDQRYLKYRGYEWFSSAPSSPPSPNRNISSPFTFGQLKCRES